MYLSEARVFWLEILWPNCGSCVAGTCVTCTFTWLAYDLIFYGYLCGQRWIWILPSDWVYKHTQILEFSHEEVLVIKLIYQD